MRIALDAMGGDHAPAPIVAGAVQAVLADPELACKTLQGVTTDVVGNCGLGIAPHAPALSTFGPWTPGLEDHPPWDGYLGYMQRQRDRMTGERGDRIDNQQRAMSMSHLAELR